MRVHLTFIIDLVCYSSLCHLLYVIQQCLSAQLQDYNNIRSTPAEQGCSCWDVISHLRQFPWHQPRPNDPRFPGAVGHHCAPALLMVVTCLLSPSWSRQRKNALWCLTILHLLPQKLFKERNKKRRWQQIAARSDQRRRRSAPNFSLKDFFA